MMQHDTAHSSTIDATRRAATLAAAAQWRQTGDPSALRSLAREAWERVGKGAPPIAEEWARELGVARSRLAVWRKDDPSGIGSHLVAQDGFRLTRGSKELQDAHAAASRGDEQALVRLVTEAHAQCALPVKLAAWAKALDIPKRTLEKWRGRYPVLASLGIAGRGRPKRLPEATSTVSPAD